MPDLAFEYHPSAIEEAREAYGWYAEIDIQIATRFEAELKHAKNQILQRPQGWSSYDHGTRCFKFRKFPYGLVYIVLEDKSCSRTRLWAWLSAICTVVLGTGVTD